MTAARDRRSAQTPQAASSGGVNPTPMQLTINGRFLTQGMTGVQRFAAEVTQAIARRGTPIRLLAPAGTPDRLGEVPVEHVGTRGGQAWEQLDLPAVSNPAPLLSLGNTAPLRGGGKRYLVIHDAGVFDTPESYSFAFRSWYRTLHLLLPRLGTQIITVSEFSRGRLAARLRLDPARIGVMPEGGEHVLRVAADDAVLAKHGLAPRHPPRRATHARRLPASRRSAPDPAAAAPQGGRARIPTR